MSITKNSISKKISQDINIPNKISIKFLNKFLETVKSHLEYEKCVKFTRFGTFYTKSTPKRLGRNPKSMKCYIIKPGKKISFISSVKVKKDIN